MHEPVTYFVLSRSDPRHGHLTEAGWQLVERLEHQLEQGQLVDEIAGRWRTEGPPRPAAAPPWSVESLLFLLMIAQLSRNQFEAEIRGL